MEYFGSPGFTITKSSKINGEDTKPVFVWSTEKVEKLIDDYQSGKADIKGYKNTPFFSRDIQYRAPNLAYEYTAEELDELMHSEKDVKYFAANHVTIKDEDGRLLRLKHLRDYQEEMLDGFIHNRFNIIMSSRQTGKCYLPDTEVYVGDILKNNLSKTPVFELYFNELKKQKTLSFINILKWGLYKLHFFVKKS